MMRQLWKAVFGNRDVRPVRRAPRRRPALETLEDRCVPTLTWIGPAGGLWSVGANWTGGVAPTSGASVQFGSALGGANTNSVDDIAGLNVYDMTIDNSYGATYPFPNTITLNQSLGILDNLTQRGGTIATENSQQILTIGYVATYDWYGGELFGNGELLIANKTKPVTSGLMIIDGGQYLGLNVVNNGTIVWGGANSADILMSNDAVITNNHQFTIACDHAITDAGWSGTFGSYLINGPGGSVTKNTTTGTTTVSIGEITANVNYGGINDQSGVLYFEDGGNSFYNENTIIAADEVAFAGIFQQVPNTINPGVKPATALTAANATLDFAGAEVNAGSVGATLSGDDVYFEVLTIGTGGTVSVGYGGSSPAGVTVTSPSDIADSGLLQIANNVVLNLPSVHVQAGAAMQSIATVVSGPPTLIPVLNGQLVNAGTLTLGYLIVNGEVDQIMGETDFNTVNSPAGAALVVNTTVGGTGEFGVQTGTVNTGAGSEIVVAGGFFLDGTLNVLAGTSVVGDMTNGGIVNLTNVLSSNLGVTGNYYQNGFLNVIAPYSNGSNAILTGDQLSVGGAITFASGVINVSGNPTPGGINQFYQAIACNTFLPGSVVINLPSSSYLASILTSAPNNPFGLANGLWLFY
jgi:hypothetical protein